MHQLPSSHGKWGQLLKISLPFQEFLKTQLQHFVIANASDSDHQIKDRFHPTGGRGPANIASKAASLCSLHLF